MTPTTPTRLLAALALAFCLDAQAADYPKDAPRSAYVNLFEWKWRDVANECRYFLGPKGYAAVQVSPPQESISGPAWWTRYQPLSYRIAGRSGSEYEFKAMVDTCKAAGVAVYVDVVINHMAGSTSRDYPGVPYQPSDFHTPCDIRDEDYRQDRWRVMNCSLPGLPDLATGRDTVRGKIADYLKKLLSLGAAGFRIDAAKHIHEDDIAAILQRVPGNYFVTQEVISDGVTPVAAYFKNGTVNEFKYIYLMKNAFDRQAGQNLAGLKQVLDPTTNPWGLMPSLNATVFVNNHDTERKKPDGVSYDSMNVYFGPMHRLAHTLMLAWPYGYPQVMSGYYFQHDHDMGPPASALYDGPKDSTPACTPDADPTKASGWDCVHRSRFVAGMVGFRNYTLPAWQVDNWVNDGGDRIAFSRGRLGFVAINRHDSASWNSTFQTGLAAGQYCDVISGERRQDGSCSGKTVTVDARGHASVTIAPMDALAIHIGEKRGGDHSNSVAVTFSLRAQTVPGENLALVGDRPELGDWQSAAAVPCTTTSASYPLWTCSPVRLAPNQTVEFKFIKRQGSQVIWENGANRSYGVPGSGPVSRDEGQWR
ncbi:carbohydrate-binding module family 20 domain-containing protein [Chitinimonas lacunae]|uniref:Alpha-amylase n=1 Tax=Chitinimonas lacunae TaxID=1963018 RepID=A0ABV8MTU4_9NEIS